MQRKYFDIHTSLGRKSVWDERFPRDPETLIKDMAYYRIHGSLFIQNEGMEYSLIQGNRKSNSKMMIFGIPQLISFISKHIPLRKGDLITTGTPEGIGPLSPGDTVEIEIEGVGILRNTVE